MTSPRALLIAHMRQDFAYFGLRSMQYLNPGTDLKTNWHLFVTAHCLQAFAEGHIKNLIINLPPRNAKSILASIALPVWILGKDPTQRLICASYGIDLAAGLGRQSRLLLEAPWVHEVFPDLHLGDKATEELLTTSQHGFRRATSVGGALTGLGGDYLIIDDPTKASDALSDSARDAANLWFTNTAATRLDDKRTGGILIVQQRQHVEDLTGHVIAMAPDDWTVLKLPAIAQEDERFELSSGRVFTRTAGEALHPEREPVWLLEGLKRQLGTYDFSAQYLQDPLPRDGTILKWSWFRSFDLPSLVKGPGDDIIQSWDTAIKGAQHHDPSVCTTWLWRGNNLYLIDVFRARISYPQLKLKVVELSERFNADTVLVEEAGSGQLLLQDLEDSPVRLIGLIPEGDKELRLLRASRNIEAGRVHLPKDAVWLQDLQRELLAFPRVRNDDQVDSLSQLLNWEGLSWRVDSALMDEHLKEAIRWQAERAARRDMSFAEWAWRQNWPKAPWDE